MLWVAPECVGEGRPGVRVLALLSGRDTTVHQGICRHRGQYRSEHILPFCMETWSVPRRRTTDGRIAGRVMLRIP
jgi:hypothetical protein